ncbi:hypothetical protein DMC63_24955 [Streptomyces sp. WAC 05977]|nr:hypothetical protein DMC63_24955 [Streptomyces sp. WAC 05977]
MEPKTLPGREGRQGPPSQHGHATEHSRGTHDLGHLALPEGWTGWDITPEQEVRVSELLFEFLAGREAAG